MDARSAHTAQETHNLTERNCTNNWIEISPRLSHTHTQTPPQEREGERERTSARERESMPASLIFVQKFLTNLLKPKKWVEKRGALECILIDFFFIFPPAFTHSRMAWVLASRSVPRGVCVTLQLHFGDSSEFPSELSEFPVGDLLWVRLQFLSSIILSFN